LNPWRIVHTFLCDLWHDFLAKQKNLLVGPPRIKKDAICCRIYGFLGDF